MIDNHQATATIRQHDSINEPFPLDDGSVQMVITSPPYFNAREEYASWPTYQAYLDDMMKVWRESWRVLCDGGRIAVNVNLGYGRPNQPGGYILIGDDTAYALRDAGFTLRGHIIWCKNDYGNRSESAGTGWGSWRSASDPSLRDAHEIILVAHKGKSRREPVGVSTISADDFMNATNSVWYIHTAPHEWHPAPSRPKSRVAWLSCIPTWAIPCLTRSRARARPSKWPTS